MCCNLNDYFWTLFSLFDNAVKKNVLSSVTDRSFCDHAPVTEHTMLRSLSAPMSFSQPVAGKEIFNLPLTHGLEGSMKKSLTLLSLLVVVMVCVDARATKCGGQRTTLWSWLLLATLSGSKVELRLWRLCVQSTTPSGTCSGQLFMFYLEFTLNSLSSTILYFCLCSGIDPLETSYDVVLDIYKR